MCLVATRQVSLTKVMCGAPWKVCVISESDHKLTMPRYAWEVWSNDLFI